MNNPQQPQEPRPTIEPKTVTDNAAERYMVGPNVLAYQRRMRQIEETLAELPPAAPVNREASRVRSNRLSDIMLNGWRDGAERAPQREGTPVSLGVITPEVCAEHAGTYLMPHGTPDSIMLYTLNHKGVPTDAHVHSSTHRTVGTIAFDAWQHLNLGRTAFTDWSNTGTRPAAWHELGPAS